MKKLGMSRIEMEGSKEGVLKIFRSAWFCCLLWASLVRLHYAEAQGAK